jgi:hypothetical protein
MHPLPLQTSDEEATVKLVTLNKLSSRRKPGIPCIIYFPFIFLYFCLVCLFLFVISVIIWMREGLLLIDKAEKQENHQVNTFHYYTFVEI